MKLSKLILASLLLLILCSSVYAQTDSILQASSKGIKTMIDDANVLLDDMISAHHEGMKTLTIERKYAKKFNEIESKIDLTIRNEREAATKAEISLHDVKKWERQFDLKMLMHKIEELRKLGIHLKKLTSYEAFDLEQNVTDEHNTFSVGIPADWDVIHNYKEHSLMSAGFFQVDGAIYKTGFSVDKTDFGRPNMTELFYEDHINAMRSGFKNFQIIEEKSFELDDNEFMEANISYSSGETTIYEMIFYTYIGNAGYVMHGSMTKDNHEEMYELYLSIVESFKIK